MFLVGCSLKMYVAYMKKIVFCFGSNQSEKTNSIKSSYCRHLKFNYFINHLKKTPVANHTTQLFQASLASFPGEFSLHQIFSFELVDLEVLVLQAVMPYTGDVS